MNLRQILSIRITADDQELRTALAAASKNIAAWGAAAVGTMAATTAAFIKMGMESADATAKLAQRLGTTSEQINIMARAGDMAGVAFDTMRQGSQDLSKRLAQVAATASGPTKDALDRLGLSVSAVQAMPLTERIGTLNKAIKEQVPATQQLSVAMALYGEEAGFAMTQLNADGIAAATAQIHKWGAALSDVDAAKIEAANDTISETKLGFQALTQQLAAQVAPVLGGIGQKFIDVAADGDGMKNKIKEFYDIAIAGAGFLADAWRGLEVVLAGLKAAIAEMMAMTARGALSVVESIEGVNNQLLRGVNTVIRAQNAVNPFTKLAEIDIQESGIVQQFRMVADSVTATADDFTDKFMAKLNEPMPSTSLKAWVAEVEAASQAAAAAAVAGRSAATGALDVPSVGGKGTASGGASAADTTKRDAAARAIEALKKDFATESELAQAEYSSRLQTLADALMLEQITRDQARDLAIQSEEAYAAKLVAIDENRTAKQLALEEAAAAARQAVTTGMLGNMASLMSSGSKRLFEIGKIATMAQAALDGKAAVLSSFKAGAAVGGPILGFAFAATAALATGAQIAKIASTTFGSSSGGSAGMSGSGGSVSSSAGGGGGSVVNLSLQGDTFSRAGVVSVLEQVNNAMANGGQLRVN